jgi:glycolate oxidase FAD binding subunit
MTLTSTPLETIHEHTAAIVGAEYAEVSDGLCSATPVDAQQASEVLRFASEKQLSVCAEGAGSKLGWLNTGRTNLRLLTHRMSTLREHTWQDMTCTVEAGCTWRTMQTALAEHGQHVALDPLWPEKATVGGVVAVNDSGSLRLRYGGLRDLVIGMSVVLSDGTVARSGGKVVKNVAGYDLPKLLCGSFGTLALITEVTFRLHSIAHHTASITAAAAAAEPLGELLLRLLDSHFSIQSMQLRNNSSGFALDIRLAALPKVLGPQQDGLTSIVESMGLRAEPSAQDVWSSREQLFTNSALVFKATMLPTEIAPMMQAIHDLGGSAVAQATGILTGSFASASSLQRHVALRTQLEAANRSLTFLHVPAETAFDRWGKLPDTLPLMRAVKQHFDPRGILNPGRFLGNI